MIDFSKCPCIYWSDSTKISYLQRRIIVYSLMYYDMNESCISDFEYDSITRQLIQMQNEADPKELRKSTYYYVMRDFTGGTGFNIRSRLTRYDREYLTDIAEHVHKAWEENGKRRIYK